MIFFEIIVITSLQIRILAVTVGCTIECNHNSSNYYFGSPTLTDCNKIETTNVFIKRNPSWKILIGMKLCYIYRGNAVCLSNITRTACFNQTCADKNTPFCLTKAKLIIYDTSVHISWTSLDRGVQSMLLLFNHNLECVFCAYSICIHHCTWQQTITKWIKTCNKEIGIFKNSVFIDQMKTNQNYKIILVAIAKQNLGVADVQDFKTLSTPKSLQNVGYILYENNIIFFWQELKNPINLIVESGVKSEFLYSKKVYFDSFKSTFSIKNASFCYTYCTSFLTFVGKLMSNRVIVCVKWPTQELTAPFLFDIGDGFDSHRTIIWMYSSKKWCKGYKTKIAYYIKYTTKSFEVLVDNESATLDSLFPNVIYLVRVAVFITNSYENKTGPWSNKVQFYNGNSFVPKKKVEGPYQKTISMAMVQWYINRNNDKSFFLYISMIANKTNCHAIFNECDNCQMPFHRVIVDSKTESKIQKTVAKCSLEKQNFFFSNLRIRNRFYRKNQKFAISGNWTYLLYAVNIKDMYLVYQSELSERIFTENSKVSILIFLVIMYLVIIIPGVTCKLIRDKTILPLKVTMNSFNSEIRTKNMLKQINLSIRLRNPKKRRMTL